MQVGADAGAAPGEAEHRAGGLWVAAQRDSGRPGQDLDLWLEQIRAAGPRGQRVRLSVVVNTAIRLH